MTPHLLILSKDDRSLVTFREPLIQAWLKDGGRLTIISTFSDLSLLAKFEALNIKCIRFDLKGTAVNPFQDLMSLIKLVRLFSLIKPDLILLYFAKPVIWGAIAARIVKIKKVFAMIEGLGFAFTPDTNQKQSSKKWLLGLILKQLYSLALKKVTRVFFLNTDDQDFFLKSNLVTPNQAYLLGPIGLNLADWPQKSYEPIPKKPITFLFVGRLLKEKGLLTLIQAAQKLKPLIQAGDLKIQVLGAPDQNPGAISIEEVHSWERLGLIEYLGVTQNVKPFLQAADIIVLPSFREGFPMSTQEACATGLAVITTRATGCKDSIIENQNGLFFNAGDADGLAKAIQVFLNNPNQIAQMGQQSRQMAELRFDAKIINQNLIQLFKQAY